MGFHKWPAFNTGVIGARTAVSELEKIEDVAAALATYDNAISKLAISNTKLSESEQDLLTKIFSGEFILKARQKNLFNMIDATEELSAAEKKSIKASLEGALATKIEETEIEGCTIATLKEILATTSLEKEKQKEILARYANAKAAKAESDIISTTLTGIKTSALNLGKAALAHPIIATFSALGIAIYAAYKYNENLKKAVQESIATYDELASQVSSIESELEQVRNRIQELQKLDPAQLSDPDELEKLRETNAELERELRLQQALQKQAAIDAEETAFEWLDSNANSSKYRIRKEGIINSRNPDDYYTQVDWYTYLDNELDIYQKLQDQIEQAKNDVDALIVSGIEGRELQQAQKALENLEESAKSKLKSIEGIYNDLNDFVASAIGDEADTERGQNFLEKWTSFVDRYTLALERANSTFYGGSSSPTTGTAVNLEPVEQELASLKDAIESFNSINSLLTKAKVEMASSGSASADTISELSELTDDYTKYLYEENGQIRINIAALNELAAAKNQPNYVATQSEITALENRNALLKSNIASYQEQIRAAAQSGQLTGESYKKFSDLIKTASSEIDSNNSKIKEHQKQLAIYSAIFDDIDQSATDALSSITDQFNLLKNAQDEFADSGKLSSSTLSSIVEKFPEMEDSVTLYIAGLKTSQELLLELSVAYGIDLKNYQNTIQAKLSASAEFYNTLTDEQKQLVDELGEAYGIDLTNFKTIEQKKLAFQAEIIKQLAANYGKYSNASLDGLKAQYDHLLISGGSAQEIKALGDAINTVDQYNRAIEQISFGDGLISSWDPERFIAPSSNSSSASSKEVEEYIADIDAYRDAQERLRKAQQATADVERKIEQAPYAKILSSDTAASLRDENARLLERNEILEETLGAIEYYNEIQQEIAGLNIDQTKSVFGNIDLNDRQVLDWTEDLVGQYQNAIDSWDSTAEDFLGTISTVFGGMEYFGDVPIAFSPMLQTESGAVFLDSDTVYEYIWALIDKAGEGWHSEDLLRLDTEGLEFDGLQIKNLIADIGETAEETSEMMHYLGADGAISGSYKELSSAADRLGVSVEDLAGQYDILNAEYEQNEVLVEKNQAILQNAAGAATSQFDIIRQQIALQRELIRTYGEQQAALQNLDSQRDTTITEGVQSLRELGFVVQYNAEANELWIENLDRLNELTATSKGEYDSVQEATNALRKETEDLINSITELNESNQEGAQDWLELSDSMRDAHEEIKTLLDDIVQQASDAVDSIQSVYDVLHNAADEYASSGWISVDTLQNIIGLGVEYTSYLQDENGQLVINQERIRAVIAAKTQQLAIESSLSYIEALRIAMMEDDVTELNRLLYATEAATDATWGLVYANLEFLGLNGEQYQAALNNINAIRALADSAIESIGQTADSVKTELENLRTELQTMKTGMDDILKYVMDMLKDKIQQQVDLLNEMKQAYSDIINRKKESLQATREEANYQKTVADKVKEIAKLQAQIDLLSLDDSRESQAERAKLAEELAELQESLADEQADHTYDATTEALDKMEDAYHKEKDKEIEILEDSISSYQKLYDMAISYIQSHWNTLYDELISWNTEYGSVLNSEITQAWENCLAAAQRYGSYIAALNQIEPDLSYVEERINQFSSSNSSSGSNTSTPNTTVGNTNYENSYSQDEALHAIIKKMFINAQAWHTASDSMRKALDAENLSYGLQLNQMGIRAERGTDGAWRVGNQLLFDKYRQYCYHEGGIVGGLDTRNNNELLAILKKGEVVLNDEQQAGLLELLHNAKDSIQRAMANTFAAALHQPVPVPDIAQSWMTSYSPNIEVNIHHNGAMTDADASRYGNVIADTALDKLWETMQKRGLTH